MNIMSPLWLTRTHESTLGLSQLPAETMEPLTWTTKPRVVRPVSMLSAKLLSLYATVCNV